MKRLFGVFASLTLLVSLAACADPKAEFDTLITNAQSSIESEDFEMAEAYLADATLLFPDSAVLSETQNRLHLERKATEALSATLNASSLGDWRGALENVKTIPKANKNYSIALSSVEEVYESALLEASIGAAGIDEQEQLLTAQLDLKSLGLGIDEELVSSVYQLALNTRAIELTALLENESFEAALDGRDALLELSIYEDEDLASIIEQIESGFVAWSIGQTKNMTKKADFSQASAQNKDAMARIPGNELLAAESARIRKEAEAEAAAKRKAEEAAKQKALNAMYVKEDTFENIKWYYDKNTYSRYAGNKFLLYMGQRGSATPWLRLRFQMYDDNWHFFERIVLDVDGSKYYFNPGYFEVNRDNGSGNIWEWYDHAPSSGDLRMVEKIVESNSTRIRYINDDNFYEERSVSSAQKKALANVLLAYEALGGKR